MFRSSFAAFAALLLASAPPAAAQPTAPIVPRDLMRHIEVLASDAFEGRAPATPGERRTTDYIIAELQRRGLEPGAADGSWLQPVELAERRPISHRASWRSNGRRLRADQSLITLVTSASRQRVANAPVLFVGHGLVDAERGIDQLAGVEVRGAVVLVMVEGPVAGFPSYEDRARVLADAGAAAVIGIVSDAVPFQAVAEAAREGDTALVQAGTAAPMFGAMPAGELARLIALSGGSFASILDEQPGPSFRAVPLNLSVTLEAESAVRRYTSNNVVGRIRGSGGGTGTNESVLLLGHWDHLGICRPEGEADRICNGAVDNASGIAMLIEIAGRLASRPRPFRDILILATTAEEVGLLGAEHFAANPPVPLETIVAAVNFDTVAIHGTGQPVAVIGRGLAPLDEAIAATAAASGRPMDATYAADAFIQRQDGWALARAGVPAVMVGGSFADMAALQRFLGGPYHGPDDNPGPHIPLDGAAEDANFSVALVRRLADPTLYANPQR